MKKIALIMALVFCLLSVTACANNYFTNKNTGSDIITNNDLPWNTNEGEPERKIDASLNVSTIDKQLSDGYDSKMELKSYMQYFVNHFHEPYEATEKAGDDILTLVFEFCFYNRDSFDFVKMDEATQTMYIKGEGLRKTAKLLFGASFDVSEYQRYVDSPNTAEEYSAADDTYIVPTAKDYWGGEHYYLKFGEDMTVNDNGDFVTVEATVQYSPDIMTVESEEKMEYTFRKVVDNGFLYYQIISVDPVK